MKKMIFTLWHGRMVLVIYLLSEDTTDEAARHHAISCHNRIPLQPIEYAPFEWESLLKQAEVVKYPLGGSLPQEILP